MDQPLKWSVYASYVPANYRGCSYSGTRRSKEVNAKPGLKSYLSFLFILSALLIFGELEVASVIIQRKKECTEFHVVELSHSIQN